VKIGKRGEGKDEKGVGEGKVRKDKSSKEGEEEE